jgi:hypothetical protein
VDVNDTVDPSDELIDLKEDYKILLKIGPKVALN